MFDIFLFISLSLRQLAFQKSEGAIIASCLICMYFCYVLFILLTIKKENKIRPNFSLCSTEYDKAFK